VRDHPVQRLVAGVVSRQSEAGLGKRTAPLPVIGDRSQLHLTSVLRLNLPLTTTLEIAERHYRYPANTVHVTVANLDDSNVPVATAVEQLSGRVLAPVSLRLEGFGCSADTIFVKTFYDAAFASLRKTVRRAFEMPRGPLQVIRALPYSAMAFANVVRFDGAGERPPRNITLYGLVTIDTMEIVRTDRVLSDDATEVVARISLDGGVD
jgi:hypothetical protein